jgi:hypothetical protein
MTVSISRHHPDDDVVRMQQKLAFLQLVWLLNSLKITSDSFERQQRTVLAKLDG